MIGAFLRCFGVGMDKHTLFITDLHCCSNLTKVHLSRPPENIPTASLQSSQAVLALARLVDAPGQWRLYQFDSVFFAPPWQEIRTHCKTAVMFVRIKPLQGRYCPSKASQLAITYIGSASAPDWGSTAKKRLPSRVTE